MQGRQYYFKDDSTRLRYGFIGQELEKAHPEMVRKMDDGSLAVSYMDVIAILVECVKEQQEEIDALKKRLKEWRTNRNGKELDINHINNLFVLLV